MFELTQETKDAVIAYLRDSGVIVKEASDEVLEVVLDNVVSIVKKQFGF